MVKTLILLAGLPGVGKSYISKLIAEYVKGSYYFDSDKFAKEKSMKNVQYDKLSDKEIEQLRINSQKQKIVLIKELFGKYNTIILDTCFDIPVARKMYLKMSDSDGIRIIVLEVVCSESTAKKRILKYHDPRNPGTKESRLDTYYKIKQNWKEIVWKNHEAIDSDENVETQLKKILKKYSLV